MGITKKASESCGTPDLEQPGLSCYDKILFRSDEAAGNKQIIGVIRHPELPTFQSFFSNSKTKVTLPGKDDVHWQLSAPLPVKITLSQSYFNNIPLTAFVKNMLH
jgi:hypothetical protein